MFSSVTWSTTMRWDWRKKEICVMEKTRLKEVIVFPKKGKRYWIFIEVQMFLALLSVHLLIYTWLPCILCPPSKRSFFFSIPRFFLPARGFMSLVTNIAIVRSDFKDVGFASRGRGLLPRTWPQWEKIKELYKTFFVGGISNKDDVAAFPWSLLCLPSFWRRPILSTCHDKGGVARKSETLEENEHFLTHFHLSFMSEIVATWA